MMKNSPFPGPGLSNSTVQQQEVSDSHLVHKLVMFSLGSVIVERQKLLATQIKWPALEGRRNGVLHYQHWSIFVFQNLHGFFPQLLSNIFGYSGSTDWGLKNLLRDSREFTAVRRFLSPDGAVFKLINLLQADDQHRYEFFISCLPVSCLFWLFLSSCPSFLLLSFLTNRLKLNNKNGWVSCYSVFFSLIAVSNTEFIVRGHCSSHVSKQTANTWTWRGC